MMSKKHKIKYYRFSKTVKFLHFFYLFHKYIIWYTLQFFSGFLKCASYKRFFIVES